MQTISAGQLWAGRIVSGIAVAFLLFDAGGKLMQVKPVVEWTTQLGFPASTVFPMGVVLLVGLVLYVIPRTSVLGAIWLAPSRKAPLAEPTLPAGMEKRVAR